jgi:hypothetical protein
MTLLLLAALGAVVVGFVLYPVLGREATAGDQPTEKAQELMHLAEEKARILAAIKDLDFEYKAGKLSDADYQQVRAEDLARAARVMARMEALTAGEQAAPEQVAKDAEEPKETSEITCPSCRQANPQNAKFCLQCGNRFETQIKCTKCGTELPGEARFCISCGEAIRT